MANKYEIIFKKDPLFVQEVDFVGYQGVILKYRQHAGRIIGQSIANDLILSETEDEIKFSYEE